MSKLLVIVSVALALAAHGFAQTASALAKKYPHHEVYEVQPGVQMSAKFTSSGLVCEMDIEPAHFHDDEIDQTDRLNENHIDAMLDLLVPPSERGKKQPRYNMILSDGQGMQQNDAYANLTIMLFSSHGTKVVEVKWRHREC